MKYHFDKIFIKMTTCDTASDIKYHKNDNIFILVIPEREVLQQYHGISLT